ncbi:hypothetical protein CP533_6401 [Ophiocordyceps camponoti-saundersi (nom. inval.)]|nr:hypothetical protein CP533_6401 [Ophiocordyceps camponoti-saundersi (nom. inval.)]
MAPTSFDFFPLLPCELRLHVWKLAIRPPGAGVHRLSILDNSSSSSQHVDGGDARLTAVPPPPFTTTATTSSLLKKKKRKKKSLPKHVAAAPGDASHESAWTRGNSSASLWDAGMWTACVESRQVMTRHFRLRYWQDAGRSLLRAGGYWSPAAVAEELQDMTSMAVARNDGSKEDRCFVVQPHRDLFWLEPQDWKSTVDWPTLFADLPFTSALGGYGHLSHIAVEFDPSWNVDLPKDLATLLRECTPRGFVARALAECATNRLYCFIWLIDRRLRRLARASSSSTSTITTTTTSTTTTSTTTTTTTTTTVTDEDDEGPMTFYDCDHVYVETESGDLDERQYGSKSEFGKTAVYFTQQLGIIGNGDYTLMGDDVDSFDFGVDDYLGVLADV